MAFGARSRCKIFEDFAHAVQWILEQKTRSMDISHYLDDFIMVHALKATCKYYMTTMQRLCECIGVPLSDSKTKGPCQIITFLGLTINFLKQVVTIPATKIDKATELIKEMLDTLTLKDKNKHGKVTVKSIQKLTGTLNFFCRAVPCGCPFLQRLYNLQSKAIPAHLRNRTGIRANPNFYVCLDAGARKDMVMWLQFLENKNFRVHREVPFLHFIGKELGPLVFADTSGNPNLGFGCVFPKNSPIRS